MALITTKSPNTTEWIFKGNNHILEFYSDDGAKTPEYAEIEITGVSPTPRIYPNIDGTFWFNFKKHFSSLLRDIDDDVDMSTINELDQDSYVFDWSKVVMNPTITYTIYHTDETSVQDSISLWVANGVEDIYKYKRGETTKNLRCMILSPLKLDTANRFYMRYWDGYPFDVSITRHLPALVNPTTIDNITNGESLDDLVFPYDCNRLVICNGDTSTSLEMHMPLVSATNEIRIFERTGPEYIYLDLVKMDSDCGVYLKWLNKQGGFNYWLFRSGRQEELSTRSLGSMYADYLELGETVSPNKSLGKSAEETWTLFYENLTPDDANVLAGLFTSQSVYLFTGERFSTSDNMDWLEVEISNHSFVKTDPRGKIPEVSLTIQLPNPETLTR